MSGYRAVRDDPHLRAAVRTALAAHGFSVPAGAAGAVVAERRAEGLRLRDHALRARLAPFLDGGAYDLVAEADPFLWDHLPDMAGFGHQQAVALGATEDSEAAELAAAFGAGVSVMDYLADEHDLPAFELVTPALVRGMFADSTDEGDAERRALERAQRADPRLGLLLALVAACGAGFRALRPGAAEAAWRDLADAVLELYEAARAVTVDAGSRAELAGLARAAEAKSVLPFVVVDRIVALAADQPRGRDTRASTALGAAVGLADDLVDLAKDLHRGAVNTVLVDLACRLPGGDLAGATDRDVYEVVDAGAARLCMLLEPGRAGPDGEGVLNFARATVAYWVGWETDRCPSSGPARTTRETARYLAPAVRFLLDARNDDYREAGHRLRVPRIAPDGVRIEEHVGTLFQRAIVLDALLDARACELEVPRRVVDAEAWTILRAKRRDGAGGWSYLPEVTELPPDADDLAAVLRVLVRAGGRDLALACREPVDLVLASADAGGGMPTWILEDGPHSEIHRAYVEFTRSGGTHPDVVANLLSALVLFGEPHHREAVARAAAYLERAQDEDGAWASRWYAGRCYGTCRAITALALTAPQSPALDRAADFLLGSRRATGGWGDPLATALAAIGLAELARCRELDGAAAVLAEAAGQLASARETDGGWPACPFISFPRSDDAEMHVYASRTVTTAFCVQALLACATPGRADVVPDAESRSRSR